MMAVTNKAFQDEIGRGIDNNHSLGFHQAPQGGPASGTSAQPPIKPADSGSIELQVDGVKVKEVNEEKTPSYYSGNIVAVGLERFRDNVNVCCSKNSKLLKKLTLILLTIVFIVYIGAVIRQFQNIDHEAINWCQGHGLAFIIFCLLTWTITYYNLVIPYLFPFLKEYFICFSKTWRKLRLTIAGLVAVSLLVFIIWDTSSNRRRLLSFIGLLTFIAVGFLLSKYPTSVRWRTIFSGLLIQFVMGILAIRWRIGRQAFKCVGHLTETFLEYSYVGALMVYGNQLIMQEAVFAFKALSATFFISMIVQVLFYLEWMQIIYLKLGWILQMSMGTTIMESALSATFFISMIVQVLFYLEWMQIICLKLGWILQMSMGTTIMESVNAVASVFLGMTEAPLLYKPYIKDLTPSEVHAVMVGGFSTIAGTVFAAYTSFGVDSANIITAALMTAPAALCYAKLLYPETNQTKTDFKNIQIYKSNDKNLMDAAVQGALVGINIVQGIIATIIACVSFIAFLNEFIAWLGMLAGIQDFTLEMILSYLLFPIVWLMGVEPSQCLLISRLIGMKITVNEFVAYRGLGELKKNGTISVRTEAIATFALCSFANPGSLGILISTLSTLCPSQRSNIVKLSIRAILCSVVVTFLTACIAGTLMPEEGFID